MSILSVKNLEKKFGDHNYNASINIKHRLIIMISIAFFLFVHSENIIRQINKTYHSPNIYFPHESLI